MTKVSAADTTDFYYDFNRRKILSKNNLDFFIQYFAGFRVPERGETYRFVLKFEDFNFNFFGGTSVVNTDWVAMERSFKKNGVATILFPHANKALGGEEYICQDDVYMTEVYNFPIRFFKSKQHQEEMLELFERAMLAFPASMEIENKHGYQIIMKPHVNPVVDCIYGAKIEFTSELKKQLEAGGFIK